ncbi:MAG: hypothetical protein IKC03_05385, partial [Oscillospiraceae bacterium]|nr:hypothetical protein [Oscillospiraceae bacterium]
MEKPIFSPYFTMVSMPSAELAKMSASISAVPAGSITTTVNDADAFGAGIVASFGEGSANYTNSLCVIENCENYGSVSGIGADSAGILSR